MKARTPGRPRSVLGFFLLALPWHACVPHVDIEGAPCPCPEGHQCCDTLSGCIPSHRTCPDTYPASSNAPCGQNGDCPAGELCQSHSDQTGDLAGPQICRRDCSAGLPCPPPETCALVLSDGAPVGEGKLARVCTAPDLVFACPSAECMDCDPSRLGTTFCLDKAVHACFQRIHPECGLICSLDLVQSCGSAGCMDSGGGTCNAQPTGDPCVQFSCDACPNGVEPGEFACDGTRGIVGCLTAEHAAGPCSIICKVVEIDCPGSSACVDDGYPRCVP